MSLSSPSWLHTIGQPEMKGNYSGVQMRDGGCFLKTSASSIFTHCISVHVWERKRESTVELLAQGHTTRDMLNTHLHMLSASMLTHTHEHTHAIHTCTHALRMAFVLSYLIQARLYMSIFGSASFNKDELLSNNQFWENGIISAKCSPSLPLSLSQIYIHTCTVHTHSYTFCINYTL